MAAAAVVDVVLLFWFVLSVLFRSLPLLTQIPEREFIDEIVLADLMHRLIRRLTRLEEVALNFNEGF